MHEDRSQTDAKRALRSSLVSSAPHARNTLLLGGARAAVLTRPLLRGCTRVGLYCAMPDEVDTRPLAEALWRDGCALHLPVTRGRGRAARLLFVPWLQKTELTRHPGGMLQPKETQGGEQKDEGVTAQALDAVVVPGLAFDLRGGRLGRGWGCYDRALADYGGLVVGLAHACQLMARLPREAHDCGVDAVVTPMGVMPTAFRRDAVRGTPAAG